MARLYYEDRCEAAAARRAAQLGGSATWVDNHACSMLPARRRCTKLAFHNCSLKGKDLMFFADFPNLRSLQLSGTRVTDSQMEAVSRIHSLEFVNVGKTEVTDIGLSRLADCKRLRQLLFANTQVTGTAFKRLALLPALEEVNADWGVLDDEALGWLGQIETLRIVYVSGKLITDRGIVRLCRASNLQDVTVVAKITETGLNAILALPHLRCATVCGSDKIRGVWERGNDGVVRKRDNRGADAFELRFTETEH